MCLAIPMRVNSISGHAAFCSSHGISREINIFMFQYDNLKLGNYVMVHIGYAIQKIDPAQHYIKPTELDTLPTTHSSHSIGLREEMRSR